MHRSGVPCQARPVLHVLHPSPFFGTRQVSVFTSRLHGASDGCACFVLLIKRCRCLVFCLTYDHTQADGSGIRSLATSVHVYFAGMLGPAGCCTRTLSALWDPDPVSVDTSLLKPVSNYCSACDVRAGSHSWGAQELNHGGVALVVKLADRIGCQNKLNQITTRKHAVLNCGRNKLRLKASQMNLCPINGQPNLSLIPNQA